MLKTSLTARNKGATVEASNKPTEGSGPKSTFYAFLSVKYLGSCVEQLGKAALADPRKGGCHVQNNKEVGLVMCSSLPTRAIDGRIVCSCAENDRDSARLEHDNGQQDGMVA